MQWLGALQSHCGWSARVLPTLGFVYLLAACGSQGENNIKSGIVALVNDRPITVTQLDQVMQGAEHVTPAQAIESLVNEELLVQGAERQQIENEAPVAQAIEASRRQIIARSFAEQTLYIKRVVSPDEANDFYKANPLLFEKRKRFLMKDFFLDGARLDGALAAALENAHSETDLSALLERNNITYVTHVDALSVDQLPLDKLSEFEHAQVGDVMTAHQGDGRALLMLITDIQDDTPLSFERAKPYIESYLLSMRNRQALNDYLNRVKTQSKIFYANDLPVTKAGNADKVVQ